MKNFTQQFLKNSVLDFPEYSAFWRWVGDPVQHLRIQQPLSVVNTRKIFSPNLASLIAATHKQLSDIQIDLHNVQISSFDFAEFVEYVEIVRQRSLNFMPEKPKYFDMNSVAIVCPIVDLINHSFNPNCKIAGVYHEHQSESFVQVKSIKEIKENEELLLNYGNYPNQEFLMRFGFLNADNQFNEMQIQFDFSSVLEYTNYRLEFKQKVLKTMKDFELDGNYTLFTNKINPVIIEALRIYFLTEEDFAQKPEINQFTFQDFSQMISKQNEIRLCQFMHNSLTKQLENIAQIKLKTLNFQDVRISPESSDIISLEGPSQVHLLTWQNQHYRNMLQACLEEDDILSKNIQFFQNKLHELAQL